MASQKHMAEKKITDFLPIRNQNNIFASKRYVTERDCCIAGHIFCKRKLLTVLVRRKCACVDVNIRVNFDGCDTYSTIFEYSSKGTSYDAFPNATDNTTSN